MEEIMPLEGFRQMTLTAIPKLPNGEKSGFQLDCEAICQVAPYLKRFADEVVVEQGGDELIYLILAEIKKFVAQFYPTDDVAPEPDDLPKFDIVTPMNRQQRRETSRKRGTFRPGEGWS